MTTGTEPRTEAWLRARSPAWRELEARLAEIEDGRRTPPSIAQDAVRSYAELSRDVAIARRAAPDSALGQRLERAYVRLHRSLFRPAGHLGRDLARLFQHDVPAVAYELRHRIGVVAIGFFLAAAAGWWLVTSHAELARLFASEKMIDTVQRGQLWTDDLLNIMPSSVLSVAIFANNITVALLAFCVGSLYGIGTIYIVALNGLMLGGAFAFTASHDLAGRLFAFVAAHGFVELTVIFIASAIGFSIGEAIARPGHRSRTVAFQRATSRGAKLMVPCLVFLVGAGLIEGYVSPNPAVPLWARLAIGIGYWLLLLFVLRGFRLPQRIGRKPKASGADEGPPG